MLLLTMGVLAAAAGSLVLWDPLDIDERRHVRRVSMQAARFVRSELLADLQARLDALERFASECATIDEASKDCHDIEPPSIARSIQWVDLRPATEEPGSDFDSDPELQSALRELVAREPASPVIVPEASSSSDRIRIVVPTFRAGRTAGFLIAGIDTTTAFREMLAAHAKSGFVISVGGANEEVYRTSASSGPAEEAFTEQLPLEFLGATWVIHAWPDTETLIANRSTLPELALILGALLGLLVMLASTSVQQARRKSAESRRFQQQLVATVVRSQDHERRRLAREMHDSTAQTLSMVAMILDAARHDLQPRHDLKQAEELREAAELLDRAMLEIRTMSYILHPPLLDQLGLSHALRWFAEGFSRRARVDLHLEIDTDLPRLAPDAELTLFRVAQEALANVHRHSGSDTAAVHLFGDGNVVTLEVIDHGRGMTNELLGQARDSFGALGVGLTGMRECVQELGGTFELRSTENGTSIRAALPAAPAHLRPDAPVGTMTAQTAS